MALAGCLSLGNRFHSGSCFGCLAASSSSNPLHFSLLQRYKFSAASWVAFLIFVSPSADHVIFDRCEPKLCMS
ncbi:hypothetical protein EJB05_02591 [Eragrostis curvula]|uniref:Uncharacterized protein n=1 Tax=Eragrostis curvula TaxID=38414 RepID=A0A5J9WQY9_9POAL|nr:hypothetical protein EJB05_02591 [Eragrostis curvula]